VVFPPAVPQPLRAHQLGPVLVPNALVLGPPPPWVPASLLARHEPQHGDVRLRQLATEPWEVQGTAPPETVRELVWPGTFDGSSKQGDLDSVRRLGKVIARRISSPRKLTTIARPAPIRASGLIHCVCGPQHPDSHPTSPLCLQGPVPGLRGPGVRPVTLCQLISRVSLGNGTCGMDVAGMTARSWDAFDEPSRSGICLLGLLISFSKRASRGTTRLRLLANTYLMEDITFPVPSR
jgi:hypothetical protein